MSRRQYPIHGFSRYALVARNDEHSEWDIVNLKTGRILKQGEIAPPSPGVESRPCCSLMPDVTRLSSSGKPMAVTHQIGRWVWLALEGEIPDGFDVNHINNVKHDNRRSNLNLKTRSENLNDKAIQNANRRGFKQSTPEEVRNMVRDIFSGLHTGREVARMYQKSYTHISNIKHGRHYSDVRIQLEQEGVL